MEREHSSLEPVEFVLTRNPEVRVLLVDIESSVIQVLGDGPPLVFRGTEHGLWRFARTFTAETQEAFAERAIERCHSQTARVCALQDRLDELAEKVKVQRRRLVLEQRVRAGLERELAAHDGHNRTQLKVTRIVLADGTATTEQGEAGK